MRARNIKPGFFKNEQLAECSAFARLLFPGLWMMADRNGFLEYRPKRWKAEIFPYDDVDCASLCSELEKSGLVARYAVAGSEYLFIPKFKDHQNPHKNEPESGIPQYTIANENSDKQECTEDSRNYSSTQEMAQSDRADSLLLIPDSSISNLESIAKSKSSADQVSSASAPPSASPDAGQSPEKSFYITKHKRKLVGKRLDTFNRFWTAFAYSRGKAEAADAWLDIPKITDSLVEQIVAAAEREAAARPGIVASGHSPKWAQGWISGRRWEDEPDIPPQTETLDEYMTRIGAVAQ